MSDLIERQAVLDAVEKNACNTQRIYDAINALPSAQSEQRWIPCSERLPEEDGNYLCDFNGHLYVQMFLNGHFRLYGEIKDNLITAWQPLPEPYREENT